MPYELDHLDFCALRFGGAFINSLIIALVSTILTLVIGCMAAYAFFLYVSNRGDNSLALFKVLSDGQLERIDIVPTGGKFPRHFAISPCGKAILTANQNSSKITLFHRDVDTGLISATGDEYDIPAPNYIRFF